MGIFADAQGEYAAHGIPTFPVDGARKLPAVRGYQKMGLAACRALVDKFPGHDAFGFWAGSRSRLTVLDIDVPGEAGERKLSERMARHGQSPLIVRSAGGRYHAYYRYGGEGRTIRHEGEPVDVLGSGVVIAAPSRVARGAYEIVQGSLDELDRLPRMEDADALRKCASPPRETAPARIREGERNDALWRHCMRQARHCDDFDALADVAQTFNDDAMFKPLADAEVLRAARSAWDYTRRGANWFGRGSVVAVECATVDALMTEHPDALFLLLMLRRYHSDRREFILASAMAGRLGWGLKRFRAARDKLVSRQYIRCLHPGGNGPHDPPVYGWGAPALIGAPPWGESVI